MRVLVACEESQVVCKAFRERGHEAYSCDLQPCSGGFPEWHYQRDVLEVIGQGWDLIIAHPPCTRLARSGVRWLVERNLWAEMNESADFFKIFCKMGESLKIKLAIENPIPHKYAALPKYNQIVQPWMFGHGEQKATCLWLYGLPKLTYTKEDNLFQKQTVVKGREQRSWKIGPGPERAKMRSKTYPGIARAMAEQWG